MLQDIRSPLIQEIWQRVEKFAIRRVRNCYKVSDGLDDFFQQKYERHFEVIRNVPLLQEETIPANVPQSRRYILYQGALNEGRGLSQLIKAMEELPLQLKLAGEGDLSIPLREMARNSGYNEKIAFKPEHLIKNKREEIKNWIGTISKQNWVLREEGLVFYSSFNPNYGFAQIQVLFSEIGAKMKKNNISKRLLKG